MDDNLLPAEDDDDQDQPVVAKQIVGYRGKRADVVKGPASGMRFFVVKSAEGQDPEAVDRILKATVAEEDKKKGKGTMKNSSGDESYPVNNASQLDDAIKAVGMGGADHDAIRRHIMSRAKTLGLSSKIPETWNSDGSLKESSVTKSIDSDPGTAPPAEGSDLQPVKKAEGDDADTGVDASTDVTEVLAEPDGSAPGDPEQPGSPAWEAIDAATARKWTAILARTKNALEVMSGREGQEAVTVDPDDADNAFDLQDAAAAVDFAIGILAPFAISEQAESDYGDQAMVAKAQVIGTAMAGFPASALETLEEMGPVRKAGRVLSSANEEKVRQAVTMLQQVLSTLPAAPAPEDADMAVTKVTKAAKADDEGVVAVYNSKGQFVGTVPEAQLTPVKDPVAAGGAPDATDAPADPDADQDADQDDQEAATDGTAAPATAPAPAPAAGAAPAPPAPVQKAEGPQMTEPLARVVKELRELEDNEKSLSERAVTLMEQASGLSDPIARAAVMRDVDAVRKELNRSVDPVRKASLQKQVAFEMLAMAVTPQPREQPTEVTASVTKQLTDNPKDLSALISEAVAKGVEAAREDDQRVIKELRGRLTDLEGRAAPGGLMLNPAGFSGDMGGIDVPPEVQAVRKQLDAESNPLERTRLQRLLVLELLKAGAAPRVH